MSYPLTYKNVLPLDTFKTVFEEVNSNWTLNNSSMKEDGSLSFGKEETHSLLLFDVGVRVKYLITRELKKTIQLCKIHINGQIRGQQSMIHNDFNPDDIWTFVLFVHPRWDLQWGGEFMCYDPVEQQYKYVPCLPNTGVLIPSRWDHVGHSPNAHTDNMRMSVAFSYATPERLPYIRETCPELACYL